MAQLNFKKMSTTNPWSTTLNGDITAAGLTITLTSVTGLQAPGILVIDRQDGSGTDTPTTREYVYFTSVDAGAKTVTIPNTTDGRGLMGSTAQTHTSGALVEEVFTVQHWNGIVTNVSAALNDAGTGIAVSTASVTTLNVLSVVSGAPMPLVYGTTTADVPRSKILRSSSTGTTDAAGNVTINMGHSFTIATVILTNGDDDVNSGDVFLSMNPAVPASYYATAQQYLPVMARIASTGTSLTSTAIRVNWIAVGN